jgi:hypothetical protein
VTFSPDGVGLHRSHLEVSNNTDHDSMTFTLQGHGE